VKPCLWLPTKAYRRPWLRRSLEEVWLVFGNDSVLGEKPSDLQLDPVASLLRPPTRLRAMDLLPGALPTAWNGKPERTAVGQIYSELKNQKGRPWPTRQFIDVLNEAVNKGILVRVAAARNSRRSRCCSTPAITQQKLATTIGMVPSRLVALVEDVEKQSLIERRENPNDRRPLCSARDGERTLHVRGDRPRFSRTFTNPVRCALAGRTAATRNSSPADCR
jgi:hypothetical protein